MQNGYYSRRFKKPFKRNSSPNSPTICPSIHITSEKLRCLEYPPIAIHDSKFTHLLSCNLSLYLQRQTLPTLSLRLGSPTRYRNVSHSRCDGTCAHRLRHSG